jgi:hypothetical protein
MLTMLTQRKALLGRLGGALVLGASLTACQSSGALNATPSDAGVLTLSATMSQPLGGAPTLSLALADLPAPLRDARRLTLLAGGVEASGMRAGAAMDFAFTGAVPAADASAKLRGVLAADARTLRLAEITVIRP